MAKDMTQAEFNAACERRGFRPAGYMGYYRLPVSAGRIMVSVLNAGSRRRDQLAYLIRQLAKAEAELTRSPLPSTNRSIARKESYRATFR